MKTYSELTDTEKKTVFEKEFRSIMGYISECPEFFDELEPAISEASDIAERNQTPWFFAEILYHEIDGAKEIINELVYESLRSATYLEDGEHCIYL